MATYPRTKFHHLGLLLALSGLGLTALVHGQENATPSPPADTAATVVQPAPIPASEIPARAESALGLLRDVSAMLAPTPRMNEIAEQVEAAATEIDRFATSREMQSLNEMSLRGLYGVRLRWQAVGTRLADWQQIVSARAQMLAAQNEQVKAQQIVWERTLSSRAEAELPGALIAQVQTIIEANKKLEASLRERLDTLLTLVSRISELSVQVAGALGAVDEAEQASRRRLLVRDAEPLWKAMITRDLAEGGIADGMQAEQQDPQEVIGDELSLAWAEQIEAVTAYLNANGDRLLAHLLMFAALAALLVLLDRKRASWPQSEGGAEETVDIVSHPYATAALVSLFLSRSIYVSAPLALFDITRLILVIPILILLRKAFVDRRRTALYALLSLFVLDVVRGLLQTQPLSGRLSLLALATLGLVTIIHSIRVDRGVMASPHGAWERMAKLLIRLFVVTLGASIIANIAGVVSLAELLGEATILSIFVGFGLYAFSLVLMGLLDLLLRSPAGRTVRAFRRNPAVIHRRVARMIDMLAVITWLIGILWFFNFWNPVWGAAVWLFSTSLSIGAFEISLGDLTGFVVAIWLGVMVSRFIRFILAEDVFSRVHLPRGVPATISMMVNYGIVTIAFFIALAVAGFDLSRFAIIAGALSVGIGFGLQNVVNNFVSGLILAFERPISVGDSLEIGTLWGRVSKIGIRSSVVRTFDGSEVIVPNADFISNQVINWTLSDVSRRLIIPVGVAYGSDPHQVLNLLVKVATEHPGILPDPEPYALFQEFGDSSLNFELRAWCDFNDGLRIKTQLNLAIHDALKEAGIEIPFPQRDLHLRSVDVAAGRALTADRTGRPLSPGETASGPDRPDDTSAIPSEGE